MNRDSFTLVPFAAFVGVGCGGAERSPATPGLDSRAYDSQACAEDTMRRSSDPALAAAAVQAFSAGCAARDGAACSMLGVAYEIGLGGPRSLPRARGYYQHACEGGNARACGNLGELLLASAASAADTRSAVDMLGTACAAGHARHCAALGRAHGSGERLPRQPALAASFLDRACRGGDGRACLDLAHELELRDQRAGGERTFELLLAACAQGDPAGCARLTDRSTRRPTLIAGAP
jgi:TPR repeat protein